MMALFIFCQLAWTAPLKVLIDPGHGGRDQGTTRNGVREADITLAVSRQLLELLAHDKRFKAKLTRSADHTLSLYRRALLAKLEIADLFLSIHVNSSPDSKAKGAEFYFQNQLPSDEESMFLAHKEDMAESDEKVEPITYDYLEQSDYSTEVRSIVGDLLDSDRIWRSSEFSKNLKMSWRGSHKSKTNSVRQAPFYVLSQIRTPSSLVELGFLTNRDDFALLTDPKQQKKMAEDLMRGLIAYKESIDKVHAIP